MGLNGIPPNMAEPKVASHPQAVSLRIAGQEGLVLTIFGSVAVTIMFVSYWLEVRSRWFVLLFAIGCGATAAYSALAGVYPITVIEALWTLVALQRFAHRSRREALLGETVALP